ncbi:MAG: membrane dipeptidase, partial [Phaeodactylibacter sp.]|nr:membrane dipeptidase [Phaeodactylibacter sp.]
MNNLSKVAFLAFIAFFFSFSKASAQPSEARLHKKADKLAHKFIITDGHVDLPYRLKVQNFRLEREYIG